MPAVVGRGKFLLEPLDTVPVDARGKGPNHRKTSLQFIKPNSMTSSVQKSA